MTKRILLALLFVAVLALPGCGDSEPNIIDVGTDAADDARAVRDRLNQRSYGVEQ